MTNACAFCVRACIASSRFTSCRCHAHKKCLAIQLRRYNEFRCPQCQAPFRVKDMTDAMAKYHYMFSRKRYKYLRDRVIYEMMTPDDWSTGDLTDSDDSD